MLPVQPGGIRSLIDRGVIPFALDVTDDSWMVACVRTLRAPQPIHGHDGPGAPTVPVGERARRRGAAMQQMGGRASRSLVAMAPVSAVALTAAAQVYVARRRFGRLVVAAGGIDLTVHPDGAEAGDEAAIELLALGDSSTAGIGVDRVEDTLPVLIASRVALGTGRPVHVLSHGRSGARTRDVIRDQLPLVSTRPDVAVLGIGTNDVTKLTRTRVLWQDTRYLLLTLNDLGIPVVMCSLPELRAMRAIPPLARIGLEIKAFGVRRAQADAARSAPDCHLVDVRRMVGQEFIGDDSYLSADRFHPSAVGYARIADALAPALVARLNGTSLAQHPRATLGVKR